MSRDSPSWRLRPLAPLGPRSVRKERSFGVARRLRPLLRRGQKASLSPDALWTGGPKTDGMPVRPRLWGFAWTVLNRLARYVAPGHDRRPQQPTSHVAAPGGERAATLWPSQVSLRAPRYSKPPGPPTGGLKSGLPSQRATAATGSHTLARAASVGPATVARSPLARLRPKRRALVRRRTAVPAIQDSVFDDLGVRRAPAQRVGYATPIGRPLTQGPTQMLARASQQSVFDDQGVRRAPVQRVGEAPQIGHPVTKGPAGMLVHAFGRSVFDDPEFRRAPVQRVVESTEIGEPPKGDRADMPGRAAAALQRRQARGRATPKRLRLFSRRLWFLPALGRQPRVRSEASPSRTQLRAPPADPSMERLAKPPEAPVVQPTASGPGHTMPKTVSSHSGVTWTRDAVSTLRTAASRRIAGTALLRRSLRPSLVRGDRSSAARAPAPLSRAAYLSGRGQEPERHVPLKTTRTDQIPEATPATSKSEPDMFSAAFRTPLGIVDRPIPMPGRLRSLARSIVGSGPLPRISAGALTQVALAAKGQHAATSHGVIHMAEPPGSDAASLGVLAHELVHAKAATRRTRYLDDTHIDEEERIARAVEAAATSAPAISAPEAPLRCGVAAGPGELAPTASGVTEATADPEEIAAEAGAGAAPRVDIDELFVAMEERLLAELDRRGGRYAGVF